MEELKFCKFCGEKIPMDAVICTKCGRQVEQLQGAKNDSPIIINNNNNNNNNAASASAGATQGNVSRRKKCCDKWISFLLCLFIGYLGIHKFYEGKIGTGILYLFTGGLFIFGWLGDIFSILNKSNPYYV